MIWKLVLYIVFVLSIIPLVFFLKRIKKEPDSLIKLISLRHLGRNKSIAVLEIEGELLVVGITDGGMTLLTKIRKKDEKIPEDFEKNLFVSEKDFEKERL